MARIETSNNAISPFQKFTCQIALDLLSRDVKVLKHLTVKKVPEQELKEINPEKECSAIKWFSCLIRNRIIWERDVKFLIEVFEVANRQDLVKKVKEYHKKMEEQGEPSTMNRKLVCKPLTDVTWNHNDALHLLLALELGYSTGSNMCKRTITACHNAINTFQGESYSPTKVELALVKFGNHSCSSNNETHEPDVAVLVQRLSTNLNIKCSMGCNGFCGGKGGESGIADALDKFVEHLQTCEKEVPKLCILVCFISNKSSNLEHFKCPHGKDAIKMCNILAEYAIPLYIIGVNLIGVQANARGITQEKKENHFLSGITLIGGGRYFEVNTVNHVEEVVQCISQENASIERIMGTVNDIIILERNKQDGDLDVEHLAEHLKEQLNVRSVTVDNIKTNTAEPLQPKESSKIAQIIAWSDDLDDAIRAVQSWEKQKAPQEEEPLHKAYACSSTEYVNQTGSGFGTSTGNYESFSSLTNEESCGTFLSSVNTSALLGVRDLLVPEQSYSRYCSFENAISLGVKRGTEPNTSTTTKGGSSYSAAPEQSSSKFSSTVGMKRKQEQSLTPIKPKRKMVKTFPTEFENKSKSANNSCGMTVAEKQSVYIDGARRMVKRQITRKAYYMINNS